MRALKSLVLLLVKLDILKIEEFSLPGELTSDQDSSAYLTNMQWTINPKWESTTWSCMGLRE